MCWNSIIGPGVIIRGFPFPVRKHNERGLEASIPVMAQLLDLHKAVTFKGGYVFKGRYTALIPVKMIRNSIQWHVVDVYPRKLEWTDIDALCPIRLFRYAKAGFFLDTRSFIGWCPAVLETLGLLIYLGVLTTTDIYTQQQVTTNTIESSIHKQACHIGGLKSINYRSVLVNGVQLRLKSLWGRRMDIFASDRMTTMLS